MMSYNSTLPKLDTETKFVVVPLQSTSSMFPDHGWLLLFAHRFVGDMLC